MLSGKYLYAIVGESGSGKSTVVSKLTDELNAKYLKSYTTRQQRNNSDVDHTFVSDEEYDKLTGIVAATFFNGYRYCATEEQIDDSDFYIVDPDGLSVLNVRYTGKKTVIPIYIDVPMEVRLKRMLKRGDSKEKAWERIIHDYDAFECIKNRSGVFSVCGKSDNTWLKVKNIISFTEIGNKKF